MGIQLIATTVLAAFYGCYVVKMIRQKKRGIQTDQTGKGKVGFIKLIEVTTKISAFLVLEAGIISIVLDASNDLISIRIIDAVVSVADTAVFITAVLTMRGSRRVDVSPTDKAELVTNGIYQFSRSPAFLGFSLLYIGILPMFFSWGLYAASVFVILMYHLQIVYMKEALLFATFGDEYL